MYRIMYFGRFSPVFFFARSFSSSIVVNAHWTALYFEWSFYCRLCCCLPFFFVHFTLSGHFQYHDPKQKSSHQFRHVEQQQKKFLLIFGLLFDVPLLLSYLANECGTYCTSFCARNWPMFFYWPFITHEARNYKNVDKTTVPIQNRNNFFSLESPKSHYIIHSGKLTVFPFVFFRNSMQ